MQIMYWLKEKYVSLGEGKCRRPEQNPTVKKHGGNVQLPVQKKVFSSDLSKRLH